MQLLLDARFATTIQVGFWDESSKPTFAEYQRSGMSLLEFLEQHTEVRKLEGIIVIPGPGGFSTVRAAALFANLASFAMKIPTLAIRPKPSESLEEIFARGKSELKRNKKSESIEPLYAGSPNITKPKKK